MVVALPQEVLEDIVDNLDSDIRALRTCALTCRALLPRSRKRLHSRFTIRFNTKTKERVKFYTEHPDLIDFVDTLEVYRPNGQNVTHILQNTTFPQVRTLILHELRMWSGVRGIVDSLRTTYSSITSLSLENISFDESNAWLAFVTSFRSLSSLTLRQVNETQRPTNLKATTGINLALLPISPSLQYLSVDCSSGVVALAEFMKQAKVSPPVRTLVINSTNRHNAHEMFLTLFKNTVTRISIAEKWGQFKDSDHALRECHQLREVAVGFQLRDGTVPWVENVLTSLNSPELRELRLKVTSSELLVHLRGKKSSKSLSQIDKALVGLLFRSPGELKVFIDIPKRFPKCMARGILNFRYF
ncbi:unnamed protein product [Somion occarium]|uniref:F-box domain-containing protein n=1 Tax=Somion occarium TaxID=3059160 RepID=A0ABP1CVN7_9APHY